MKEVMVCVRGGGAQTGDMEGDREGNNTNYV